MGVQAVWPSDLELIITLRKKKEAKEKYGKQKHVQGRCSSRPGLRAEGKEAGAPGLHRQGHVRGEGGQRGGPSVASQPVAPHNPSL